MVLEVIDAPAVDRLYFWALQADFSTVTGRPLGGAHLGLQWYPPHPGSTAVNWGGYDRSGQVLSGTRSALPSATGNENTRDLNWRPGVAYRLVIRRQAAAEGDPPGITRWSGSVSDPSGATVTVRELFVPAEAIGGVVMWSEVFARCDHPSVAVRWSDPRAVTLHGETVTPRSVSVNYQSHTDGGCANTDSSPDRLGIVQRTSTARLTAQGSVIAVPG